MGYGNFNVLQRDAIFKGVFSMVSHPHIIEQAAIASYEIKPFTTAKKKSLPWEQIDYTLRDLFTKRAGAVVKVFVDQITLPEKPVLSGGAGDIDLMVGYVNQVESVIQGLKHHAGS